MDLVDMAQQILIGIKQFLLNRGMDILAALVIAVAGYFVAAWFSRAVREMMKRSKVDPSASEFVSEMAYYMTLIVVIAISLSTLGISTTSLAAAIGGIGLGIGLAMKDNFANVASGIFILMFKPFRSGDFIEVAGQSGTVVDILTMYTRICTMGNQLIVIPNSQMTSSVIKNYSYFDTRNIEFHFNVGYHTDLAKCLAVMSETFKKSPHVLNKEGFTLFISNIGESIISIYAAVEVRRADFFAVRDELYIQIKKALDDAGIEIPYPQMVVHQETDRR